VLAIASAVWLVKRGNVAFPWRALAIVIPPIAFCSLPFIANGRVGSSRQLRQRHGRALVWAAACVRRASLRCTRYQGSIRSARTGVVATLSTLLGIGLGSGFTALSDCRRPAHGAGGSGSGPRASLWRQVLIGLVASLAYMAAAYYGRARSRRR